jgi:hypothetical protein
MANAFYLAVSITFPEISTASMKKAVLDVFLFSLLKVLFRIMIEIFWYPKLFSIFLY